MKKIACSLILMCALILSLTGCTTTKAYTFRVSTGDSIRVELNTTDGYNLSSNVPFEISKDGEVLSEGTFITIDGYNQYIELVNTDSKCQLLDSDTKDGIPYTFYCYDNSEYNYIIKINDSNTGILLGNPNSQAEAEKVFDLLTFSVV